MSLGAARKRLLGALRSRYVVPGGKPSFTGAEALEEAAKEALEAFEQLPDILALDALAKAFPEEARALHELDRDLIRRLFLRSILTLNVASKLDPGTAASINSVVNKIMAICLIPKPKPSHLRLV